MTIKTFWTILLKILGIYLVFGSLSIIPQFATTLSILEQDSEFLITALVLISTVAIYIFVLRLFVYKTDWLIDKLHLSKGFDEEKLEINIHRSTILKIAIIVIGGLVFIEDFPMFCKSIFSYFQQKSFSGYSDNSPSNGWALYYFFKSLLGYLMMTNSYRLTNLIEHQRKQ